MSNFGETSALSRHCPCCAGADCSVWMTVEDHSQVREGRHQLMRCAACRHTWLWNRPDPEEMGFYYGPQYHQAVGRNGEISLKRWRSRLQVITKHKAGGNILDIGCSSGGFLASLKGENWKLFGIEASRPTAERARLLTGGEIFAGDVMDADFPSASFDVITCFDVLEHLYEPSEVFLRVYNWLKPDGIFYIFVPNIMSWESRIFGSHWFGLDLPRHIHHFSTQSLEVLSRSFHFNNVRVVTPPGSYLEQSSSLLINEIGRKLGFKNPSLDLSTGGSLVWRIVRKGLRLTVEALYANVASSFKAAPSLDVVFQKAMGDGRAADLDFASSRAQAADTSANPVIDADPETGGKGCRDEVGVR